MSIPAFDGDGNLPPGIHAATLKEVQARFGGGSDARERQCHLLELVVEAAIQYLPIKRVLVWGSFVTDKPEPNDLDYALVVSPALDEEPIAEPHRRFIVPHEAGLRYGVDRGYLVVRDYPLQVYLRRMDFICRRRGEIPRGIVEISLRGEVGERHDDS